MARKRRIPVVGTQQLNVAQLSPEERKIISHRNREAARREYAPVIRADRAGYGTAAAEYRTQAQSAKGATSAVQDSLAQALAGLKSSGLSGRALQQTKQEFTSRAADAASSLPALLAGAGEEKAKAFGETRQNILEDKAQMQQSAASKTNESLKEARGAASSVLAAQEKKAQEASEASKPDAATQHALQNATNALKESLAVWAENKPIEEKGEFEGMTPQEINPLKTIDDWRKFAHGIEKNYDGVDITDAMTVIQKLLANRSRPMHEGRLPQPGVPYGPRQSTGY